MARELGWYLCGSASSLSSSSPESSWSSLDQHFDDEGTTGTMPMSPQNGLLFCRETVTAKVFARLIKPTEPSGEKQGKKYPPPKQGPFNCLKFPPIVGYQEKGPDLTYGASPAYKAEQPLTQGSKKSRIPVPKKNNVCRAENTKLPALQMGRNLLANNSIIHSETQPLKRPKVKRLAKPQMAICEALELLSKNDWEKKIAGLQIVRSLCVHHQDTAALRIQDLHAAVINEVKNLRSAVSRAAMVCLGDMFDGLQDKMLSGLNISVRILLQKSGDCNTFLREAAEEALSSMALNINPGRALAALIDGGISHLNASVRTSAIKQIHNVIRRSGADYILSGGRGITDRAIPAIARSAQDGCPEVRMHGRNTLQLLAHHPKLMPMMRKYITPQNFPTIKKIICAIK